MLLVALIVIWSVVFALWSWMKPRHPMSPPVYPGAWPIIGHAHKLIGNAQHAWTFEKNIYNYCLRNEHVVEVRLGTHSLFILTDPDDCLTVANKCLEKPYVYSFGKEMFGSGLVTATGTTLGLKTDENRVTMKNYAHALEDLFSLYLDRGQRIWLHLPYIFNWSSYKKKENNLMKVMKDITKAEITKRKSDLRLNGSSDKSNDTESEQFKPLLDQMLDLADKQDAFTEDEIREHLDTIIAASYDTTATTITFSLILIGSHQDVQERIYKELQEVLGNQERDLTRHDLPKLVYLEAVIKEVVRLYPAGPRFARCSSTDVQLKKYILPANSSYLVSVYGLNRHPMWGADADQFRPERWLDSATLPENPSAFATFSLGKRNCIGKLYAMMVVKTTLPYILRAYRIKSDMGKLVTRCDAVQKPVSGHEISLESRT